jgi:hypothetical protein
MMRALFAVLFLVQALPVGAETGLFLKSSCSSISSPVAGSTWCFDSTSSELKKWTGSAWTSIVPPLVDTAFTTGDVKLTIKTVADSGWVLMNDGTIGNASSGATSRANADTESLFTLLWTNCADAQCAVSSGRGASAAADFSANKTIALPKALGRALAAYGTGSGLTARAMGATVGTETHTLSISEIPAHDHGVAGSYAMGAGGNTNTVGGSGSVSSGTNLISSAGGGSAHNIMQPTVFLNVMIKL